MFMACLARVASSAGAGVIPNLWEDPCDLRMRSFRFNSPADVWSAP